MTYTLEIHIDDTPKSPNALGKAGWWYTQAERKKWRTLIGVHCIGKKPEAPLKKAKVSYVRASSRQSDFDNLVSGFKFIQDSLVFNKIIVDDSPQTIECKYEWQKVKPKMKYITVKVEEITA